MASVIKNNQIQEVDDKEVDVEIPSFSRLVSTHANAIPLSSNAQSPRIFYGTRFLNQAMPIANPEAPLIQTMDPEDGVSFEKKFGERMGARYWRSDLGGVVKNINNDSITITDDKGKDHEVGLYNNFQFNRKTYITNKPQVQIGQRIEPNQLLASSNYTDSNGVMSMGQNARVAMLPYKGFSMDDAIVVSESFAKRMSSQHNYQHDIQKDQETKFGKNHFTSIFPTKFTKAQLQNLDDNGLVKPGTILQKGDPIVLATRPKSISSNSEHLGKLGKIFKTVRQDASEVWDHDYPGIVTDSVNGKKTVKAFITADVPLQKGDKIIGQRVGQKDIVSKILPDEQMLRSLDGKPFDVLLNPLALPSRVNTSALYELALGKLAAKTGQPIVVSSYTKRGSSRLKEVFEELEKNGISPVEEVFDPVSGKKLDKPVTTGMSYIYKLHHVVASKQSARGTGSYDQNEQPVKGGGDNAQAKRLGGLEVTDLLAKGGYETLREGSTLRGQQNQEYWRMLRQGYKPSNPGVPFVFDKFRVLLNGAGLNTKHIGQGTLRLQPFTDKELESKNPMEIKNGKMVNTATLASIEDGLFDARMVAGNRWGKVTLDAPMPNPAFEKQICQMLGIKQADMRKIIAGEMTIEEAQKK